MKVNITWDTPQGRNRQYVLGKATDFNTKNVEVADDLAVLLINLQTLNVMVEKALEGLYITGQVPNEAKGVLECLYLTHVNDAVRAELLEAEKRLKNKDSVRRTRVLSQTSSENSE